MTTAQIVCPLQRLCTHPGHWLSTISNTAPGNRPKTHLGGVGFRGAIDEQVCRAVALPQAGDTLHPALAHVMLLPVSGLLPRASVLAVRIVAAQVVRQITPAAILSLAGAQVVWPTAVALRHAAAAVVACTLEKDVHARCAWKLDDMPQATLRRA